MNQIAKEEKKKDKACILKERSEKLAHLDLESKEENAIELVEFLLAKEHYAVESLYVREVHSLKELTPLPCVPSFVLGVINVRRRIVSVIDLREVFELHADADISKGKVIILEQGEMEFGIFAEEILGLKKVFPEDLQNNFPTLTGVYQEFLKGVTEEQLLVLDAEKLLNASTLVVQESAEG